MRELRPIWGSACSVGQGSARLVLGYVSDENEAGAQLRPQTTCRSIGVVLGIQHRTPWDRAGDTWRAMRGKSVDEKLAMIRDP